MKVEEVEGESDTVQKHTKRAPDVDRQAEELTNKTEGLTSALDYLPNIIRWALLT